ncbi:MAG: protein kinase [Planctomycetes bacterium]|nr:protein kinase [Planctomycetota bacterium]
MNEPFRDDADDREEGEARPSPGSADSEETCGAPLPGEGEFASLRERYDVLEILGRGGQGVVYRVRNRSLDRLEVLKILRLPERKDPTVFLRFEREARALAQLRHPNILPIYAVDRIGEHPYYTMEYFPGESVAGLLHRSGSFAPRAAMAIGRDVARGLAAAHARGIVHRDVKPGNILVLVEGTPGETERDAARLLASGRTGPIRAVLVDFGLAKVAGELTLTGEGRKMLGTILYMSPEQAGGHVRQVKAPSDLFSLGATMYQMLTGRYPFPGRSAMEIQRRIIECRPRPPSEWRPSLSKSIDQVVMRCLARNAADRYPGAGALGDDIDRYLRGEPVLARPRSRRRRVLFAAAGVALLAAIGWLAATSFLVSPPAPEERGTGEEPGPPPRAFEGEFEKLLAAGHLDEAIELALRREDPSKVDLAGAHLSRAEARARNDPIGSRVDLAFAYRAALARGDPRSGREALLRSGRAARERGDIAAATAANALALARFGKNPEVEAELARSLERSGRLEEAAARWRDLVPDPVRGDEARTSLARLGYLLPRRRIAAPPGAFEAFDLDGDARAELVRVDPGPSIVVESAGPEGLAPVASLSIASSWIPGSVAVLAAGDADGDGTKELLVAFGAGEKRAGRLLACRFAGGNLRLLAQADLPSHAHDIEVADADGDGRPEILVAVGYFERAVWTFHLESGSLVRTAALPVGCDPLFLEVLPGGAPGGRPRLLVHLGPWLPDRGFRLVLLEGGPGGAWRLVGEGPDRFVADGAVSLSQGEMVLSASQRTEHVAVLPDLAETGLYRATIGPESPARLDRIRGPGPEELDGAEPTLSGVVARADLGKRRVVFLRREGLVLLDPFEGTREVYGTWAQPACRAVSAGDLDGDGEDEILFRAGGGLAVWGLAGPGDVLPATPADVPPATGSAAEDLLACGLAPEAEALFRHETGGSAHGAGAWFGLGESLARQGKMREAAEAYERAALVPQLAERAGLARVRALRTARDWRRLARALEALVGSRGLDPQAAREVAEMKSWAIPAAAMAGAARVTDWREGVPLACENPFQARTTGEGLEVWAGSSRQSAAGLLVAYRGGPIRVRVCFRVARLDWETDAWIGLDRLDRLGPPPENTSPAAAPYLLVGLRASGATDAPTDRIEWVAGSDSGRFGGKEAGSGPPPELLGRTCSLELEFIPGLDRAFAVLEDADSPDRKALLSFEIPFQLPPGVYSLGRGVYRREAYGGDYRAQVVIQSVEVESSEPAASLGSFDAASPGERVLEANGALARGLLDEAERIYESAIRLAGDAADPGALARAHLFRALLRLRRDGPDGAAGEIRRALEIAPDETLAILRSGAQALPEDEGALLLRLATR